MPCRVRKEVLLEPRMVRATPQGLQLEKIRKPPPLIFKKKSKISGEGYLCSKSKKTGLSRWDCIEMKDKLTMPTIGHFNECALDFAYLRVRWALIWSNMLLVYIYGRQAGGPRQQRQNLIIYKQVFKKSI